MRRFSFTFLAALSLTLGVLIAIFWIWSYWKGEILHYSNVEYGNTPGQSPFRVKGITVTFERGRIGLHARSELFLGYFGQMPTQGNHFGSFAFPPSDPPLSQIYVCMCCGGSPVDDVICNRAGIYVGTRGSTRSWRIRNWTIETPAAFPLTACCAIPSL